MPTRPPRAHTTGSAAPPPRVSARKRGYDTKWEQARRGFLAKHPRCECPAHKGKPTAPLATVVHHITPHKGDRALFWQRSNWMAMAKPCHDTHTGRYDRPESMARRPAATAGELIYRKWLQDKDLQAAGATVSTAEDAS